MQEKIEVGFQVFASDGGEEFGAVRDVSPSGRPELVIYVENAGDFTVPMSAVDAVHSEKVILNRAKLDRRLRRAIIRSMKGRPAHHAAQREDLPLDRGAVQLGPRLIPIDVAFLARRITLRHIGAAHRPTQLLFAL